MTIECFEGFDLYPVGTGWADGTFWSYAGDFSNRLSVATSDPRNGTRAISLTPAGFGQDIYTRPVTAAASGIYGAGAAWKKTAPLDSGNTGFGFIGSTGRIMVTMDATGRFVVQRSGVVILTGTTVYNNGLYNYVEVEYNGAATTATLRVNNTVEATGPCASIGVVATTFFGRWSNPGISGALWLDDFCAWNGDGVYSNTFPGDLAVLTVFPDADTADADWTPVPAGSGFSRIDNVPPDAAQYIESVSVGDVSVFDVATPVGAIFQVLGVAHQFRAQKTTAGTGEMRGSLVIGGSTIAGANRVLTNGTYNSFQDIVTINPLTGQPFLPGDLAGAQVAYERTA